MIVAAGETKAAPAIGALEGPRDVLRRAGRDAFAHGRIAAVRAIAALHCVNGSHVGEDGRDAFHVRREAHMKIPFVVGLEGLHAARDGMLGELCKVRGPVRVHRPIRLEATALPRDEFFVALFGDWLDGVMDGEKPNALVHELAEQFQIFPLQRRMASAAVAINHHRIRALEN